MTFLVAFEHSRHRGDLRLSESRNFLSHHSRSLGFGLCAALRYAQTTSDPGLGMIKSELIDRIASQNPHLYQRDVENIVNAIFDEIVKALGRGDRVELRDFGVFSAKIRGARKGRNPKTGAEVQVAQRVL